MGFCSTFLILLWKNRIIHFRHYLATAFEILLPLLFSLLMFSSMYVWEIRLNQKFEEDQDIEYKPEEFADYSTMKILYAPNTTDANRLMATINSYDLGFGLEGYESENSIKAFANSVESTFLWREKNWVAIIFSDINFNITPSLLSYKLRFPSQASLPDPEMAYYNNEVHERLEEVESFYTQKFVWLQFLVDSTFIKLQQEEMGIPAKDITITMRILPIPKAVLKYYGLPLLSIIPFFIIFGFILISPIILVRIMDEKNIGAKEMMKMMGMSVIKYWGSTFLYYFILMVLNSILITIIFSIPYGDEMIILQDTSPALYILTMLLFYASSLLFCFIITVIFSKASAAVIVLLVVGIASLVVSYVITNMELTLLEKTLTCLLPNISFYWAMHIMNSEQVFANGSQWSTILAPVYGSTDSFCLAIVLGMMLINCVLYSILLWYLDAVWPWQPGVPKSPLFCFSQLCHSSQNMTVDLKSQHQKHSECMEEEPSHLNPSIVISHLTKVFKIGSKQIKAVNDLSLNVYPGQITAFLGQNGAGKTTVMNMLTGIFPPTSGTIFINDYNIVSETDAARRNLALCPQHNILYDELTVKEHLKLFAGLKGMSRSKINKEVKKLLKELEFEDQRNTMSKILSLGMKRKLSLGNAIIGNSKVLILDEPTTGLDPESRHVIWNIIQKLRSDRTILLTTHYMEEADILGDRIAIIGNGIMQCCGSPLYLKRKFGDGYHLNIEKDNDCQVDNIMNIILQHIPDGKLLTNTKHKLLYSLSSDSEKFSSLFEDIERYSIDFGILSYGVTIPTIDDVFMKVGQKIEKQFSRNTDNGDTSFLEQYHNGETSDKDYSRIRGPRFTQQLKALLFKRVHHSKRQIPLLILQAIIPLITFLLFVFLRAISRKNEPLDFPEFVYDLDTMFFDTKYGFYEIEGNSADNVTSIAKYYTEILKKENVEVINITNAIEYLMEKGNEEHYQYIREYVVGSSFEETAEKLSVTAWYNRIHYHLPTISLNLLTNALLQYITNDSSSKIQIISQKFPVQKVSKSSSVNELFDVINLLVNSLIFSLGLGFLSATFIFFPIYERASKAKLLQTMCGVNSIVHSLMNMLWDFIIFIFCSLLMLIPFFIYHGYNQFIAVDSVGAIFICLMLYGLASLSFIYMLSYTMTSPSVGFTIAVIVNCLSGIILLPMMMFWQWIEPFSKYMNTVFWILRLLPNFSVTFGIYNIHKLGVANVKCFNLVKSDHLKECIVGLFRPEPFCCTRSSCGVKDMPSYLSLEEEAAGKECLCLAISAFLYFLIILLIEQKPWKVYYAHRATLKSTQTRQSMSIIKENQDSDMIYERQRVENLLSQQAINEEALIVSNLTKYYGSLAAVKELTFSIRKKECVGLVGVNGAGKTTVFRMLTGDIMPTKGNAFIGNFSIQHKMRKFLLSFGYCPQVDSFIDSLTGRETLEMFANLRGIANDAVQDNVRKLITMCGIETEADKPARSYSGGTKRKLCLAIALIGIPDVILLDETTAGVDPLFRHKLSKILLKIKNLSGASLILCSHSMDECKSLCDRIAIMVKGEFHFLGTLQRLKTRYSEGYTLMVKVCMIDDTSFGRLQNIKAYIKNFLPSSALKLEVQGTLHYQITDISMKFSYMFSVMEKAKQKFHLEDYVLSDNPLEQIFLALTCTPRDRLSNVEVTNL